MFEILAIGIIIVAIGFWFFGQSTFTPPQTKPSDARTYKNFERVDNLFVNRSELAFFQTLKRNLPREYSLLAKVRLEDVIRVKRSVSNAEVRWKLRGRVKSRHVDYLVIDEVGEPVVAIELDGNSHNEQTANADALKDGLFSAASLPLVRVRTREDFLKVSLQICEQYCGMS